MDINVGDIYIAIPERHWTVKITKVENKYCSRGKDRIHFQYESGTGGWMGSDTFKKYYELVSPVISLDHALELLNKPDKSAGTIERVRDTNKFIVHATIIKGCHDAPSVEFVYGYEE